MDIIHLLFYLELPAFRILDSTSVFRRILCILAQLIEQIPIPGPQSVQVQRPWTSHISAVTSSGCKSCGVCGGQWGTGAGFLWVLRFPMPLVYCTNFSTIITIYYPYLFHSSHIDKCMWLQVLSLSQKVMTETRDESVFCYESRYQDVRRVPWVSSSASRGPGRCVCP